jgi:phospholipid-binding lipoprotein MlaA
VGTVVDLFTNPLDYALPSPERHYGKALKVVSKVNKRGRFDATVDSVLHESADSYTQAKLLYLQNRRYELGDTGGDTYVDVYEDPYAE